MRAFTLFLLLLNCGFVRSVYAVEPLEVSLVQLIARPKDYQGKFVRVIGFVRLEFEGNAVYLHQDDYRHGITKNGLWIDIPEKNRLDYKDCDQKYVLLEGTFNAKDVGHLGLWSGSIQKVIRCQAWR